MAQTTCATSAAYLHGAAHAYHSLNFLLIFFFIFSSYICQYLCICITTQDGISILISKGRILNMKKTQSLVDLRMDSPVQENRIPGQKRTLTGQDRWNLNTILDHWNLNQAH